MVELSFCVERDAVVTGIVVVAVGANAVSESVAGGTDMSVQ